MGTLIIYSAIAIPFRFGFTSGYESSEFFIWDSIVTFFFFLDVLGFYLTHILKISFLLYFIIANFNTAVIDKSSDKVYVFDRRIIFREYIKFWFWIDLLAIIPFDLIVEAIIGFYNLSFISIRILKILRLFRIGRLLKLIRNKSWNDYFESLNINVSILNLFILILQIFFICHLYACIWGFLALDVTYNWIDLNGLNPVNIYDTYVDALYFIVVTMCTVGYGDIKAVTQSEYAFAIIAMLTAGLLFGALLSKVNILLDKRNPQAKAYKEKMGELRSYLDSYPFTSNLKNRAKVFINMYKILFNT